MANGDLEKRFKGGQLYLVDKMPHGDPRIASALTTFVDSVNLNKNSRQWARSARWMENILFGLGSHYHTLRINNLSRDSSTGSLNVVKEFSRDIPKPTNDLLGRYVETNISLLTENRPRPRITAKSDDIADKNAADLGELTIEFLWEELDMPEKCREMARLLMYCGVCWLEVIYDPTQPKHIMAPSMATEATTLLPGPEGMPSIEAPIEREVPVLDEQGRPVLTGKAAFGDIKATVVSPFEMHMPTGHWWNTDDMGWIMRESYLPIDVIKDRYLNTKLKGVTTKANGWFLENLEKIRPSDLMNLPLWWWSQLADQIEGPGPIANVGSAEHLNDNAVIRIFDRKPNARWPKGRTVIVVGDQLIYDSPKKIGARAFDPRWPKRWHPYIRFRWEAQPASVYGRSLVSKLLPNLKRINSIDTSLIMWRRVVPIAKWIMPKGSNPVDNIDSGFPGSYIEYNVRATLGREPKPVYPPDYPAGILNERQMMISEMEATAGTEEILRGQRPVGVNSAMMLDALRRQALASRAPVLQSWDEGLQLIGSSLLMETIKHVGPDPRYAEYIKILAREKKSSLSIQDFSGSLLSDNVQVRYDTASMAMVSREAKQARAIEVMQFAPGLMSLPANLRAALIDDLGWPGILAPQGADINRARMLIHWIKTNKFELVVPMAEDDPYVIHSILVEKMKDESFLDFTNEQIKMMFAMVEHYEQQIEKIEQQKLLLEQMAQSGAIAGAPGEEPA